MMDDFDDNDSSTEIYEHNKFFDHDDYDRKFERE